jgi:hypothetical protein
MRERERENVSYRELSSQPQQTEINPPFIYNFFVPS